MMILQIIGFRWHIAKTTMTPAIVVVIQVSGHFAIYVLEGLEFMSAVAFILQNTVERFYIRIEVWCINRDSFMVNPQSI